MEFTLDTMAIAEIGYNLSKSLMEHGVKEAELVIPLEDKWFGKVDEDLFYRNREEGSDEKFVPSDKEIKVEVNGLTITFVKKDNGVQELES